MDVDIYAHSDQNNTSIANKASGYLLSFLYMCKRKAQKRWIFLFGQDFLEPASLGAEEQPYLAWILWLKNYRVNADELDFEALREKKDNLCKMRFLL